MIFTSTVPKLAMALVAALFVAACDEIPSPTTPIDSAPITPGKPSSTFQNKAQAERAFAQVTERVEPVAERECRARTDGSNCDYRIVVDPDPSQPANAFQTFDKDGRPIIAFTIALINEARNADEIAFVMGHEAAHHIAGHIARQQRNSAATALVLGGIAALGGASQASVDTAVQWGAQVGARVYSKDFELEADALGTIISARAGYSPLNGAKFFSRIPDPGDRFLGTHPPNADRQRIVRETVAKL
ncbi:MAG: M48 family metallopeptidase [Ascidiaceihabitans sp.]|nr:M48 family metallopeptidase [Ascidiaceihabitans sp.]